MPSINRIVVAAGLFAAALFPTAAAAQATAMIEDLYRAYQTQNPTSANAPNVMDRKWYSARINKQIAAMNAACKRKKEDMCGPGYDFFVDGQDYEIKNVKVREVSRAGNKAVVEAKFTNMGDWRTMTFDMVEENGRWVIDQLNGKSKEQPKGYKLTDLLKP